MTKKILRRNTRQRQVVLEELRKLDTHPTASDIYEITRRRLPKISLGTIYRNLELLVQMGFVRRLETTGSEARFDGDVAAHYHIRCGRCGRVADAHGLAEDPVKADVSELAGYEIIGFHLEFEGICPECRASSSAGARTAAPREMD